MNRDPLPALPAFAAGIALTALVFLFLHPSSPPTLTGNSGSLRFTPFSVEPGGQNYAVWSPDGRAVAFAARQQQIDFPRIFIRRFDPPSTTPITMAQGPVLAPVSWTLDGRIIFYTTRSPRGLWSLSPSGGVPELLQKEGSEDTALSISRDGSAVAQLHHGDDGYGVWISTPPGSLPTEYEPAPFASRTPITRGATGFSPDGKQILFLGDRGSGEEIWLLPFPAQPSKPPHRILGTLPAGGSGAPEFSWMPDNRRIVFSTSPEDNAKNQLFIADTVTGSFSVISAGLRDQRWPAVSPDGNRVLYEELNDDFDVVSVDLSSGAVTPLIATERAEEMPSWSAKQSSLVYSTDRSGSYEIWIHKPGLLDQPIVTARDFPADTTRWLMGPSLSPDGTRVIYRRTERGTTGKRALWISPVSGGPPVPLLGKGHQGAVDPGSWSADGDWYVYMEASNGERTLNKVRTAGESEPQILAHFLRRAGPSAALLPVWSPAGNWILYSDHGLKMVSPDGKQMRDLHLPADALCTFSGKGTGLYCLSAEPDAPTAPLQLFSADLQGRIQRKIGTLSPEYAPSASFIPALRLSLSPDGGSIAFSIRKASANLWMIEGFTSFLGRH